MLVHDFPCFGDGRHHSMLDIIMDHLEIVTSVTCPTFPTQGLSFESFAAIFWKNDIMRSNVASDPPGLIEGPLLAA